VQRYRASHTATLLNGGDLLVTGEIGALRASKENVGLGFSVRQLAERPAWMFEVTLRWRSGIGKERKVTIVSRDVCEEVQLVKNLQSSEARLCQSLRSTHARKPVMPV
jgi:hypothetical protein